MRFAPALPSSCYRVAETIPGKPACRSPLRGIGEAPRAQRNVLSIPRRGDQVWGPAGKSCAAPAARRRSASRIAADRGPARGRLKTTWRQRSHAARPKSSRNAAQRSVPSRPAVRPDAEARVLPILSSRCESGPLPQRRGSSRRACYRFRTSPLAAEPHARPRQQPSPVTTVAGEMPASAGCDAERAATLQSCVMRQCLEGLSAQLAGRMRAALHPQQRAGENRSMLSRIWGIAVFCSPGPTRSVSRAFACAASGPEHAVITPVSDQRGSERSERTRFRRPSQVVARPRTTNLPLPLAWSTRSARDRAGAPAARSPARRRLKSRCRRPHRRPACARCAAWRWRRSRCCRRSRTPARRRGPRRAARFPAAAARWSTAPRRARAGAPPTAHSPQWPGVATIPVARQDGEPPRSGRSSGRHIHRAAALQRSMIVFPVPTCAAADRATIECRDPVTLCAQGARAGHQRSHSSHAGAAFRSCRK